MVSGDDPLHSSELFSEALRIFDQRPSLVVVYPDWQIIDHGGDVQKLVVTKDYSFEAMLGLNICIPGPGAIFRTKAEILTCGLEVILTFG